MRQRSRAVESAPPVRRRRRGMRLTLSVSDPESDRLRGAEPTFGPPAGAFGAAGASLPLSPSPSLPLSLAG